MYINYFKPLPLATILSRCMMVKIPMRDYTNVATGITKSNEKPIKIPSHIQRSPTDILETLARTIDRDPTASHYKYCDDPYLIPMSNIAKRTFAMAQESGRKSAEWIKNQHRDLFLHEEAQPEIKKFAPDMVFDEQSNVDVLLLQQLITRADVKDALFVYNALEQKNIPIDVKEIQCLLELICFFNNEEPVPEEYIEERWFKQHSDMRERHRKAWKDNDLAEKLFAKIEPKSARTYAAIIRGMSKYHQAERAYALFQQSIDQPFELDTETFNAIISTAVFLKETADQRWEFCCNILQQMYQRKLKPNSGTLNALLECISSFGNFKFARSSALKVLAEFKNMAISPTLGAYYYVLIIFCRDRAPVSHVIIDILNEIRDKQFRIEHAKDTFFFATAMDICRNHLLDKGLAKQVDNMLHSGNNYDLIGDSFKETVYYRNYLALLCQTETIDDFMRTYDLLVPNVYTPEPGIMEQILKAIEYNAEVKLIPRLWSDMVIFDHTNRDGLLRRVLQILVDSKLDKVDPVVKDRLPAQFAKIALDIYKIVEQQPVRRGQTKVSFTGQMIGDILTLLVRGADFEHAAEVFNYIEKQQHSIPGTPSESTILEFIDACIEYKSPSLAINAVQYAVENSMEPLSIAIKVYDGFTLNEIHLSKLKSLVGDIA